jgi:hypothetical protein
LRCDVTVQEYGDLTPRELMLILEAYNEKEQQKREESLTAAYMSAYFQRVKRMPSLKQVLEDSRPRRSVPQTPDQMLAAVKMLQAQFGGEEGVGDGSS